MTKSMVQIKVTLHDGTETEAIVWLTDADVTNILADTKPPVTEREQTPAEWVAAHVEITLECLTM